MCEGTELGDQQALECKVQLSPAALGRALSWMCTALQREAGSLKTTAVARAWAGSSLSHDPFLGSLCPHGPVPVRCRCYRHRPRLAVRVPHAGPPTMTGAKVCFVFSPGGAVTLLRTSKNPRRGLPRVLGLAARHSGSLCHVSAVRPGLCYFKILQRVRTRRILPSCPEGSKSKCLLSASSP